MTMRRLLLRPTLRCFLCLVATASAVLVEDINDPSSKQLVLEDISLLLASFDVTGLCHPTSDQHAPIFPKCGTTALQQESRLLEDGGYVDDAYASEQDQYEKAEEEIDNYNNYYQLDMDDAVQDDLAGYGPYRYRQRAGEEEFVTVKTYIFHACLTMICVCVGAISSGLYVGMVSLDPLVVVIKSRTAKTEKERKRLDFLLATIKQKHQVIVTLLIINVLSAESLPIFLQQFVHGGVAVVASVVLVLIFGEILPALIFTGSDQVDVACRLAPIVRMLMCLLYPLSYPVAYLLEVISSGGVDNLASETECHQGTVYSRGELAALIRVQYEERRALKQQRKAAQQWELSSINDLDKSLNLVTNPSSSIELRNNKRDIHASLMSIDSHDVNMLEGALQLKTKTALDIYLNHHKVFCIPEDMVLNESAVFTIYASGFSRVPVFADGDRRRIKGILMTRQLMVVKRDEGDPTLAQLSLQRPRCVAPDTNLVELINLFQSGARSTKNRPGHMALVCGRPEIGDAALQSGEALPENAGFMGIITFEDVLEALLQDQIYDEMDQPSSGDRRDPSAEHAYERRNSAEHAYERRNSLRALVDGMATIQESNSYHTMNS